VWEALRAFDPARPVYVESESKKVGNVSIPTSLVERMRSSACLNLTLPLAERVELLMEDYDYFVHNIEHFCTRLDALTQARGKELVTEWKEKVRSGNIRVVVKELLVDHYDPVYLQSMERNFVRFAQALDITPADHGFTAMTALSETVVQTTGL
jgi:tRNA 2-selenouridine synthase